MSPRLPIDRDAAFLGNPPEDPGTSGYPTNCGVSGGARMLGQVSQKGSIPVNRKPRRHLFNRAPPIPPTPVNKKGCFLFESSSFIPSYFLFSFLFFPFFSLFYYLFSCIFSLHSSLVSQAHFGFSRWLRIKPSIVILLFLRFPVVAPIG